MKLNPNSWHYKIYAFNSQLVAAWMHKDDYHYYPKIGSFGIGLCPYMRMILIWGPLVALTNVVPFAAIYAAFIMFPGFAAGGAGIFWLIFTLASIVGFFVLLAKIKDWASERQERREESQLRRQDPDYQEPEGFWRLVGGYLKSMKTKICPVLEIQDD